MRSASESFLFSTWKLFAPLNFFHVIVIDTTIKFFAKSCNCLKTFECTCAINLTFLPASCLYKKSRRIFQNLQHWHIRKGILRFAVDSFKSSEKHFLSSERTAGILTFIFIIFFQLCILSHYHKKRRNCPPLFMILWIWSLNKTWSLLK